MSNIGIPMLFNLADVLAVELALYSPAKGRDFVRGGADIKIEGLKTTGVTLNVRALSSILYKNEITLLLHIGGDLGVLIMELSKSKNFIMSFVDLSDVEEKSRASLLEHKGLLNYDEAESFFENVILAQYKSSGGGAWSRVEGIGVAKNMDERGTG